MGIARGLVQFTLLLACGSVAGCGAASGIMLAGNLFNAAAIAAVDAAKENAMNKAESERQRGMHEFMLREGANSGDADSSYAYASLLAGRKDPAALRYMCEAGAAGHPLAQLSLGHWYNEDRRREDPWPFIRIRPHDPSAYVWYTLALENGVSTAAIFRESLVKARMDNSELQWSLVAASNWIGGACAIPQMRHAGNQVRDTTIR